MTWADSFLHTLKANDVRLISYVPDNVLTPLIAGADAAHRRQVDQAGLHHAKPGRLHPLAALDRRQSTRRRAAEMRKAAAMAAPTIDAVEVKVLSRADLTKRLVAKLTRDEAVVGG